MKGVYSFVPRRIYIYIYAQSVHTLSKSCLQNLHCVLNTLCVYTVYNVYVHCPNTYIRILYTLCSTHCVHTHTYVRTLCTENTRNAHSIVGDIVVTILPTILYEYEISFKT